MRLKIIPRKFFPNVIAALFDIVLRILPYLPFLILFTFLYFLCSLSLLNTESCIVIATNMSHAFFFSEKSDYGTPMRLLNSLISCTCLKISCLPFSVQFGNSELYGSTCLSREHDALTLCSFFQRLSCFTSWKICREVQPRLQAHRSESSH